jgi:subtilisin family serine protease
MKASFGRLAAAAIFTLTLGTASHAQDKIAPSVARAALETGKVRVIIVTRANTEFRDGGNALRRPGTYLSRSLGLKAQSIKPIGELPMVTALVTPEALQDLRDDPNVAYVVKDELRKPALFDTVKSTGGEIHAKAGFSGKGWTMAVLDSGVDRNHPSFAGAIKSEGCFSTSLDSAEGRSVSLCKDGAQRAYGKAAAMNCDMEFSENCFHGTHVAGIMAGRPVQLQDGRIIRGMAPESGLIVAQVFSGMSGEANCGAPGNCILAWDSDIIAALEWVYKKRQKFKIASINMSLGGGDAKEPCDGQSPYTEIFQRLRDAGIATVVATGNEAIKDGIGFPACVSAAVSVAATMKNGKIDERYSNVARFVTIAAPGSDIASAAPGNSFIAANGTSMAAPHVAGAFALLRQAHPKMSVTDLVKLMQKTGRTVTDSRTGTKLKRMDLARIKPGEPDPVSTAQNTPRDADDMAFETQSQLTSFGNSDMRTVIVQSNLSAEDIKSRLGAACKEAEGCDVTSLGGGSFRVTVPFALVQSLGAAGGLEQKLESAIGGGAKVFRNNLNRPLAPKTQAIQ